MRRSSSVRVSVRWRRTLLLPVGLVLASGLLGYSCDEDAEPNWVQYNGDDDVVTIEVGSADELDEVATDLHSDVVGNVIGTATVDPGGGPIGTTHTVTVIIDDEFENDVGLVTVRTDSGDRGEDEYELDNDMSDEGAWGLQIISVGEEGEQRSDTLTFRLWYDSEEDTTAGDTGS